MSREDIEELAQRLASAAESIPRALIDKDEQERNASVLLAAQQLGRVIRRTPWEVIPESWLTPLQERCELLADAIEVYNEANEKTDPFPVEWDEIISLWSLLAPFLPAMIPEESVSEDAVSFRRSAGQHLRRIGEEAEKAYAETERVRSELAEVESERDKALQTIRDQQAALEETIAQQQGRLEEAIRQNQQQFSEAQERHSTQVAAFLAEKTKNLDEAVGDADSRTAKAVEAAESEASEVLARLIALEKRALKSYNTIGNAAVAGHYQRDANMQGRQAIFWRVVAVVVFLLVGIGTIVELASNGGTLEWAQTRSRIPIIVGLGALATFAVAEVAVHRRAERASRRREIELSSLDPFLTLISPVEAERIKIAYARRVFVEQPLDELGIYLSDPPADEE